jgi:hypothetical protein
VHTYTKISDIGARTHINSDYADQPRFAPIKAARRALIIAAVEDNPTGAQILSVMKRCGDMLHMVCVSYCFANVKLNIKQTNTTPTNRLVNDVINEIAGRIQTNAYTIENDTGDELGTGLYPG